jgi:hypothetical protein
MPLWAEEGVRSHTYVFDQPELVSAQRVFGVGNATIMLAEACHEFPEASAAYNVWLQRNEPFFQRLAVMLAVYYRIDPEVPDIRERVANAMHLKTVLDLSSTTLKEACPTMPQTLASPHYDLQDRYQVSLKEVQDPNYFNPRRRSLMHPAVAPMDQSP